MNEKREIRTLDCQLSVRELAPDEKGESRTITGTAIVFDVESEILDGWGREFREIIKPEACTKEWLDTQDIKMNMLHDRQLTIARCNKGEGSLRLSVDEKGVNFEFDAPKCDIGDRCLEMVRRGDYSGCSFEFWPKSYDIDEREDGVLITHRELGGISALTIGMDPAYRQTSVNARELWEETEKGKAEKAERERLQAEEQARAEAEKTDALRREQRRRLEVMRRNYEKEF